MPFERPQLPQLIEQGATEFESRLPGVLVRVRRSLVGVICRVLAGGLSALYQYAEYLNRQAWPDTCDVEYLDRHGARWKVTRTPATGASGSLGMTGVNGTVISAGTQWLRSDGVVYTTDVAAEIVAGTATVAVTAVTTGQASNAGNGITLNLSSPIAGLNSTATATTALSGGSDVEDHEPYRARILARIRKPPNGGKTEDYIAWAKEVPGVTRAWAYPDEQGRGSMVVRFVRDNDASIIPDAGEVATVQAYIEAQRPATARVYVVAPIPVPQNYTLSVTPNTAAVKAAVDAEFAAMIKRDAEPGGTLFISRIREAASIAAGENNHAFTSPNADVVFSTGQLAVKGVTTWL